MNTATQNKNSKPLVSVAMITYGHEKYIVEAIKGVFGQQVPFTVELVICDDCSPDNTPTVISKIIAEAPENVNVRYLRHKENMGMMNNFIYCIEQCTGEFIAICEGDDTWTDVNKLTKQVQFLQNNPECSMVFTNAEIEIVDPDRQFNNNNGLVPLTESRWYSPKEIYEYWIVPTASVIFRSKVIDNRIKTLFKNKNFIFADILVFLHCASKGKIFGMMDYTVKYRRHAGGATNKPVDLGFYKKDFMHTTALIKNFGTDLLTKRVKFRLADESLSIGLHYLNERKILNGLKYLFYSLKYRPQNTFQYFHSRIKK